MTSNTNTNYGQALPAGTRLEEFVIERVLGSGGFGITYLARDTRLNRQVVIKENLPVQFCFRDTHSLTVAPRHTHGDDVENFRWSLENFSKEAAMLASLKHPGIVSVLRSFEAFGTAYFVMPFVEGIPFDTLIEERRTTGQEFSERELKSLLQRMLNALDYLHDRGIYHRDIKPGNILITSDGVPILIDFGSARQRLSERSMTVIESAGYTPFEQLQSRGNVGPWSDLYALAGSLIKAITFDTPPKAHDRIRNDPHVPLAKRPELASRYSPAMLAALDRAFEVDEGSRWQNAGEWLAALGGKSSVSVTRTIQLAPTIIELNRNSEDRASGSQRSGSGQKRLGKANGKPLKICIALTLMALATVCGLTLWNGNGMKKAATLGVSSDPFSPTLDVGVEQQRETERLRRNEEAKEQARWKEQVERDKAQAAAMASQQREADLSKKDAEALALEAFALIPAGSFLMGDTFKDGNPDELPVHQVEVSAFHMGKYEVTKALWDKVRTWGIEHGYADLPEGKGKADNHPVYLINWDDIVKWCNARSEMDDLIPCYTVGGEVCKTGANRPTCNGSASGYRLPTEAEWEKAARGGLSGKRFPWGDEVSHSQANFNNQGKEVYQNRGAGNHPAHNEGTSPVGSFEANGYGLYDMAGNLWEICSDWYSTKYYASSPEKDPQGPATGSTRVIRGGCWFDVGEKCRSAERGLNATPSDRFLTYGFRLARSAVSPETRALDATSQKGGIKKAITNVAINCAPKRSTGNIFSAPDRASIHPDYKGGGEVGMSWTLLAHKKIVTSNGTFLSGDLISPRGGKMTNGPYYVLESEWEE